MTDGDVSSSLSLCCFASPFDSSPIKMSRVQPLYVSTLKECHCGHRSFSIGHETSAVVHLMSGAQCHSARGGARAADAVLLAGPSLSLSTVRRATHLEQLI